MENLYRLISPLSLKKAVYRAYRECPNATLMMDPKLDFIALQCRYELVESCPSRKSQNIYFSLL